VFLILNGHYPGEANRTDATPTNAACPVGRSTSSNPTIRAGINGGDGWLRYMTFKPSENKIYVYTYSPKLGQFETDANSQFVLDYNMQGVAFTQIATNNNVTSGTDTQTTWSGRTGNTQYQWYATVSDGNQTVTGPTWSFTTAAPANNPPVAGDSTSSTNERHDGHGQPGDAHRQRHRSRGQPVGGHLGLERHERHGRPQCQRLDHVHARGELQRHRGIRLHGE
jgi:hypothetical protein